MHLNAFKLSSLPPLPFPLSAIVFKVSNACRLCNGLLCTNSVNADNLSDSVPELIILLKNAASEPDAEEDALNTCTSVACRLAALKRRGSSCETDSVAAGCFRGGNAECQEDTGWKVNRDFESTVIFVGKGSGTAFVGGGGAEALASAVLGVAFLEEIGCFLEAG